MSLWELFVQNVCVCICRYETRLVWNAGIREVNTRGRAQSDSVDVTITGAIRLVSAKFIYTFF